jgi:uncharacterized membrane protein
MKKSLLLLVITLTLLFHPGQPFGHGIITHLGVAQNIIDRIKQGNSGIPDSIASVIAKNSATEKAFRGGALDSDLFVIVYGDSSILKVNRSTHDGCSILIASILLKNARTDVEKAYAFGWALAHLPSDVIGHPLVNKYVGNGGWWGENEGVKWDYDSGSREGTNALHVQTEYQFDGLTLDKFGYDVVDAPRGTVLKPRLNLDIDVPITFLQNAIIEGTGEYPEMFPLYAAELLMQAYLKVRADFLANSEPRAQDARFNENYGDSLKEIINWMKDPTFINRNYSLDDGTTHEGECQKMQVPIIRPGAGSDHADDTVDSSSLESYGEVSFEDWLRIGVKNGNRGALLMYELKIKLEAIRALPEEGDSILRFQKEQELIDFVKANINEAGIIETFRESNAAIIKDLGIIEEVGILNNGFSKEMAILTAKCKEPTVRIEPATLLELHKSKRVIIIPSGGLYGLEKSEYFKASLDEYVKQGGTLIVFAQQHGYEFSVLPVPQEPDGSYRRITGYGWSEDQSCFYGSSYFDKWHQILSGQSRTTPNINVDGYFMDYPSTATVVLRRTANAQPDLLMYEYGQGRVIVTSMYSDYAFKQNQASPDEIALIRDMISWAKAPANLEEIMPGQTVSISMGVANRTTNNASSVRLSIYNPGRTTLLSEQNVNITVPTGQTVTIPVTYTTTPTSTLGIYHIDYTLLDDQGSIIQPRAESDSGRFVVSNPPRGYTQVNQITFSIHSDAERYAVGNSVTLTVLAFNSSDSDRVITAKFDGRIETMTVPGNGSTGFVYSRTARCDFDHYGQCWGRAPVNFYEGTKHIHSLQGLYRTYPLSAKVTVQTDKTFYAKGETVIINVSLKNNLPLSWTSDVRIIVWGSRVGPVFSDSKTLTLSPLGTGMVSTSFTPTNLPIGNYGIEVSGSFTGMGWGEIEFTQSQISVSPNFSSAIHKGMNTIPFTITNKGKVAVSSGTLDLNLKDPDGYTVYSESLPFALTVGEAKTLNVLLDISSPKLGPYTLNYSQSDETRTGTPTNITIVNSVHLSSHFDKDSYAVRETAQLTVNVVNDGKFDLEDVSVTVSAPDANYTESKTNPLLVSQGTEWIAYSFQIPETITAGMHYIDITMTLPSGSLRTVTQRYTIPGSSLRVSYTGAGELRVGDSIIVNVTNIGGLDTDIIYTASLPATGVPVAANTGEDTLRAGETKTYSLRVPSQATEGTYILLAEAIDKRTNRKVSISANLTISGLKAVLTTTTDRNIYFTSESIEVLSQIANQAYGIEDGHLYLEIVDRCNWGMIGSYHFFTWDGSAWVSREILHYSNTLETRLIDLSAYLPDSSGEYKVRIRHVGADHAEIDYIGLVVNDIPYTPSLASNLSTGGNITFYLSDSDNWPAYVLNNEIEVRWTGVASPGDIILLMRAQEGEIQYSPCYEQIYWQAVVPITQAPNTILNFSHAANPLFAGQYYLRGNLFSQTGQVVAQAEYRFHVIDEEIGLRFHTDKPIYREGETITITGDVVNLSLIPATGVTVEINDNNWRTIYRETINIPAEGSHSFGFSITAGQKEICQLYGSLYQNMNWVGSISEKYEVDFPMVFVTVDVPSIVGDDQFPLSATIENGSKIPATVQILAIGGSLSDTQTITLEPFETKLIQYYQSITSNTIYTFNFTGDYEETVTEEVSYGLGAAIQFGMASSELGVFAEGSIAIPVTLTNTGQLSETLEVTYQLTPGAGQQTKTYSLPVGGIVADTLYFNLTEADYQITASSQNPNAYAQTSLFVRKENQVQMEISLGTQTDGLAPVEVNLTNDGINEINGSVSFNVRTGVGQVVWSGEEGVSNLPPRGSQLLALNINPSAFEPGDYNVQVTLLTNSNQPLSTRSLSFEIQGPNFQITQLPPYQTFAAGQEAAFRFNVKNTGDQEGSFGLNFKSYDLIASNQQGWLKGGEEKSISFSFFLPEDLEEKDYFADYELRGPAEASVSMGQVKYHLSGINLNVNASLDKTNYNEGETAHLTINTQTLNPTSQNLFARVNYAGYESQQIFTLNGSQVLIFDIPLAKITGEKLFYGIYHEGGRSIHLNSLYVHKAGDIFIVTTDKQVYQPGEIVVVTLSGNANGNMTLSGPGGYSETVPFSGQLTRSFTLPAVITAGTYFVNVQLTTPNSEVITAVHPFDVAGIQVRVLECKNDKDKYASSDNISTTLTISSNTAIQSILKVWIVDPNGEYVSVGQQDINLAASENSLVTHHSSLATAVPGIHRLVYGIYGQENLLLCSGSEAFDVGNAVLLGLSTNKRDYPTNTEIVTVTMSLYGSADAELQLELDGSIVKTEPVSLNGFTTYEAQLQNVTPGPHILKGTLTAGGLKNIKETTFTYALAFMPKPQISTSPAYLDFDSINLGSSSIKTITLSSIGNVGLVIGTMVLSGANQGEFSLSNDNCSGRTIIPSGNCTLDILFSPISLGPKSASLFIPSNATNMPSLRLSLEGTGSTTLNISINPAISGRVSGAGIECPGDCTESYFNSGAVIQLTAMPMEGYLFSNWTGDIQQIQNPVTVNMDTTKNVTANFTTITCTINAVSGAGGTITPSGQVSVSHGGSQTFIITPDPGYHVTDLKVDGASAGAVTVYTLSNVTANHSIEAIFAINQYTIIATAGPNGAIVPSGTLLLNYGWSQTFTITPDPGYHVADLKVDGVSLGAVARFTFENVTSNHLIEVTFEIDNQPPVADAGPDQNAITGQMVALNGSKSYDPEGVMITFLWAFIDVPATSNVTNTSLSDVNSAKPEFTPDVNGTYRLALIVNDGRLDSIPDEVVIYATAPNVAPNANAGPDQNVITGSPVQLDGSRSNDPDNGPVLLTYLWSFSAKPSGSQLTDSAIVNRNLPNASFIPDVNGIYELRLTISDGEHLSEDTTQIIATLPNVPPNANAGVDMTITFGDTVVLDGSASNDPDHGPQSISYLWSFVAIPAGSQLTNGDISGANTESPSFAPDVVGTYVLQLMVYDGKDAGFDNVAVTVLIDNTAPTLAPVPDKTILWPPNHRMVDITIWANASDNTGHPVVLSAVVSSNEPQDGLGDRDTSPDWTVPMIDQINGIITLKLRAERAGRGNGRIYTVTITVTDASGNSSQANVEITVPHDHSENLP